MTITPEQAQWFANTFTQMANNVELAVRGKERTVRLVLTGPDWSFGASGTAGAYDSKDSLWYAIAGVEAPAIGALIKETVTKHGLKIGRAHV